MMREILLEFLFFISVSYMFLSYTHNCLIKEKQLYVNLLVINQIFLWVAIYDSPGPPYMLG